MNSFVFRNLDVEAEENKDLVRDVQFLLDIPQDQVQTYLTFIRAFFEATTQREQGDLYDNFLDSTDEPGYRVQGIIRLVGYIVRMQAKERCPDDDWQYWADDLEELGLISGNETELAEGFFREFSKGLESIERQSKRQEFEAGVLPLLSSVGATAEARPILDKKFKPGDDPQGYSPRIVGSSIIASISFSFDSGHPSSCQFQATRKGLELLIERLEATKKEMDAIEEWVSGRN